MACCFKLKKGVSFGPKAIREAGLIARLNNPKEMEIHDYGDLVIPSFSGGNSDIFHCGDSPILNAKSNAFANQQLAGEVATILNQCKVCLTLGGDHRSNFHRGRVLVLINGQRDSGNKKTLRTTALGGRCFVCIAIGTISGHARVEPDLSVLWVDAHPDLNNPNTTPSGNLHGMPVHFFIKEMAGTVPSLPQFKWVEPILGSTNLAYIAIRDIDSGEIARDIDRHGIARCMEMLQDKINKSGKRPIHLSYDIDSVDPLIAPSTGTPAKGGLTYREAVYISEEIARSGCLRAMDLTELNPDIGSGHDSRQTSEIAVDIIAHALGRSFRDTQYRKI